MIRHTFCHIPGIGTATERILWEAGIHSWDDIGKLVSGRFPLRGVNSLERHLEASAERLRMGDARYFSALLPPDQQWRLFPNFRDSVAYLDIETNGFAGRRGYITTIALYDGGAIRHYIRDYNLHEFVDDIRGYTLIVTYNGKCFDVPYIRDDLGVVIDAAHIDLRFLLKSLGYAGGLKGCERKMGIDRGDLDGLDGYFAVLLWQDYLRRGNERALETLLAYNIQDVISLERLMVLAYNMKLSRTPCHPDGRLPLPPPPENPFRPDRPTIEKIMRRRYH